MRFIITAIFLSVPALAQDLPPVPEQAVQTETQATPTIRRIEDYLNAIRSMRAEFVQVGPDGRPASGVLKIAKPGKLRFDYQGEVPVLIVSDGDQLTFIDYEVGQVSRWPVNDTPLSLLVRDRLDLALTGYEINAGPGALPSLLTLQVRDPQDAEFGTIELTFEQAEGGALTLLGWEVEDIQGYVTRVQLRNIQTGQQFARADWQFDDPRGLSNSRRRRGR